MDFIISNEIRQRCPEFVGAAVVASVKNTEENEELWAEIAHFIEDYRLRYTTDSIKQQTDLSQSQQVNELKSQNDMLLQRSRFTTGGVAMILGIVALLAFLAFNSRWTRRIEIKNRQLQRYRS